MKNFNHYLEIIQEGSQIKPVFYEITNENKSDVLINILKYVTNIKKFKFEVDFDKQDIVEKLLKNNNVKYDIMKITKGSKETSVFSPGQAIKEISKDDNNLKFPFKGKKGSFTLQGSNVGRGEDEYGNKIPKMDPMNVEPPFQGIG